MALLDRFKQMLFPDEKQKIKRRPAEKQDADNKDALPADEEQMSVVHSQKQEQVSQLTPREHDLYLLLLEGFTLKESAKQLSIKYSTANTHMTGLYRKLGVKSRAELIINYRNINGGNRCSQ
jgi:DNA-binding CsgD family transcriptional regulator